MDTQSFNGYRFWLWGWHSSRRLAEKKSVTGYGVEIDGEKINSCIANGVSVIQQDIDAGIQNFIDMGFDVAIMASSIQLSLIHI